MLARYGKILLPLVATLVAFAIVTGLEGWLRILEPLDNSFYDARMRYLGRAQPASNIWLAGIDDDIFDHQLFRRPVHAQVIRNLKAHGVKTIFFDVLFDEERGPDTDQPLVDALREADCVVLAGRMGADDHGTPQKPMLMDPLQPLLDSNLVTMGLINISEEAERRWATLAFQVEGADMPEEPYPAAALATLARYDGLVPKDLRCTPQRIVCNPHVIPANRMRSSAGDASLITWRMPIVYHTPSTGPNRRPGGFPVVPYRRLIDNAPELEKMRGGVVFIGENTSKETDLMQTPVGPMKGFEVHAQIFNTLMAGPYWQRPLPGTTFDTVDRAISLLLCLALAALVTMQPSMRGSLFWGVCGLWLTLVAGVALTLVGYVANLAELIYMAIVALPLCMLGRFVFVASFLERFIPKEVVDRLLATGKVQEGEVTATVIVTDIRGYTTLSESKTPLQILTMLNEYHTETVSIYHRYGGNVLNYQGDAQIVLFGLPGQKMKDPAGQAIKAALETSHVVKVLRDRWGIKEEASFDVGAGVCTGPVAVGELGGAADNAEYTVIGETVRKCHKVQSMSTALDSKVLLDEPTFQACKADLPVERCENVQLEGILYPVTLYRTLNRP